MNTITEIEPTAFILQMETLESLTAQIVFTTEGHVVDAYLDMIQTYTLEGSTSFAVTELKNLQKQISMYLGMSLVNIRTRTALVYILGGTKGFEKIIKRLSDQIQRIK